ncbi:MAG: AAA family ATPase, partial [Lachnospiraceae bacterium]|nr:AAA family ATPase [Lachnospiraceae bacterium]
NSKFIKALNSEIYVDKTGLIQYTNKVMNTMQQNICVSRPRRFGKSMAADMLAAYYSRGCDSGELFKNLKIADSEDFEKYRNRYDTIFLNMQEFLSQSSCMDEMLNLLKKTVLWDLTEEYPDFRYFDRSNLMRTMQDIYQNTKCPFVIIIDEWDCIFREYKEDKTSQERYLDFLRDLLKDKAYIHLAYMTGILPIKKYGTQQVNSAESGREARLGGSALNMFSEFSMTNPHQLSEFVGFTEHEAEALCDMYHMNLSEMKEWYDGYRFERAKSIYSPKSVIEAVTSGICDTYWNQTETFEALRMYIDMNFDGLKDDVLSMMVGETVPVNTGSFGNDMTTFHTEDDVLTLLIHLGYLGYDLEHQCVFIPNNEVRREYVNAVSASQWGDVSKALKNSADTLNAIWQKRPAQVAEGINQAHFETSHLQYHDENALSYTISLALYAARNFYTVYRELPSGKGFADMVYLPKKRCPDKPALVVELKWNQTAEGAISQIKEKNYCASLEEYHGNILLVGINYDKKTREHQCSIEEYLK